MTARLQGVLGRALDANVCGRLRHFVVDASSPAITLFDPARAAANREGDWYGEHAGKWMYAAAKAARRTGDAGLAQSVRRVADYLAGVQREDGYLGTYAEDRRFTRPQAPPQRTWDGAPALRTWDVWVHACLVLGFLAAGRVEPARRIGDLVAKALDEGIDITHLGNHHGMSATVMLDPAVELYFATREAKYLDLARRIARQADERAELQLVTKALAGADAAQIATGKAYQLLWNLVGFAKLWLATFERRWLDVASNVWESVRAHHLTLGGGPWGGVALRSREVFNAPGTFSPYAYVETCSTFSWMQLNRVLLDATGEARYAEEIERSAYNDLVGAQGPNGEDWCYYSFPNGRRVHTTYWRCCKSSGAMALEDLAEAVVTRAGGDVLSINVYGPGEATLATQSAGDVRIVQATRYPFDGEIAIDIEPQRPGKFVVRARIPSWASGARARVNGEPVPAVEPGRFLELDRTWQRGDRIDLSLPMHPVVHRRSNRNVQESVAPDGSPVAQEVLRFDYVAITRGPLVYATGLIDGFKIEETLRLPGEPRLEVVEAPEGFEGPAIRLSPHGREAVTFLPYYEAGGRDDGAWRLTWMPVAPGDATPRPAPRGGTR